VAENIEGIDAGSVEIKVVADLSQMEPARLQREIDARLARVRAQIRAEVDAARLQAETQAAVKAAEKTATVRARVELDRDRLVQEAKRAAEDASRQATVKPDVDKGGLLSRFRDAIRALRGEPPVEVKATADTRELEQRVEEARQRTTSRVWEISLKVLAVGEIIAGLGALVGMAGQAAAGLFALAAAAGQAVGAIGALPGVAAAAGQGLTALIVGFTGVGTALGALAQRDKQAAAAGASAAAAREAAAQRIKAAAEQVKRAEEAVKAAQERVKEAQERAVEAAERVKEARENVAEATKRAAEAQQSAAWRIESALWREEQAHKAVQRAIERLNEARKEATRRIRDMNLAVLGGALDEEAAQLAIERAKLRLEEVMRDPRASDLDRREADLAYRQALHRLQEIRNRNQDLVEDTEELNRKGVEGSDQVTAAKEALIQAQRNEMLAVRELAQARKAADEAAVQGAKAIARAQKAVLEAIKAQQRAQKNVEKARQGVKEARERAKEAKQRLAEAKKPPKAGGGGGAPDPVAQALAELTPSMREFVLYLHNTVRPELSEIRKATQEALAPGLISGVKAAMPMLDVLQGGFRATGQTIGNFVAKFGELLGSEAFGRDLSQVMGANNAIIAEFGRASIAAFSGLTTFMRLAAPWAVLLAKRFADMTERFRTFVQSEQGQQKIVAWLERGWRTAGKLWALLKNLSSGLLSLGKAAAPAGHTLLDDLVRASERFAKWAADDDTQKKAREFFDEMVPVLRSLGELLKQISGLFKDFMLGLDPGSTTAFLDALTWIVKAFRWIAQSDIGQTILSIAGPFGILFAVLAKFVGLSGAVKVMSALFKVFGKGLGLLGKGLWGWALSWGWDVFGAYIGKRILEGIKKPFAAAKDLIGGLFGKGKGGGAAEAAADAADLIDTKKKAKPGDLVDTSKEKIKPASLFSKAKAKLSDLVQKLNPSDLISKAGQKINLSGLIQKLNPASLFKGGAKALAGVAAGVAGAVAKGASGLAGAAGKAASGLAGAAGKAAGGVQSAAGKAAGGVQSAAAKAGEMASKAAGGIAKAGQAAAATAGKLAGLAAQYGRVAAQAALANARQLAMAAGTAVVRAATVAWTAAQNLLNAAMRANPIMLIVTLITALVAGLVYAYNNVDWFRDMVDGAFRAIGQIASWLWNNVLKPVFDALVAFWNNTLAPKVTWLWKNVFEPAFKAIGDLVKGAWNNVIKPALDALVKFWNDTLAPKLNWLWKNIFEPAWKAIGSAIETAWSKVIKPGLEAFWNFITKTLPNGFQTGVNAIKKIWDTLKSVASKPAEFVVNTVYNNGIRRLWNALASKVGLPELPEVVFKGFASGGLLRGPGGPTADRIPILASNGEYIVNAAATRRWLPLLEAINSGRLPRLAAGGGISGLFASLGDWLKKGAGYAARKVLVPLRNMIDAGVGSTGLGRLLGAIPKRAIDTILAWFDANVRDEPEQRAERRARGGLIGRVPSVAYRGFASGGLVSGVAAMRWASSRALATAYRPERQPQVAAAQVRPIEIHVHPAPGMDEHALAQKTSRLLGAYLR